MPAPNSLTARGPELTEWRRDLHMHPELSYQETRTAGVVAARLRAFGFDEVHEGIGRTGVVGVLHGSEGPTPGAENAILLRADMDALPIQELPDIPHRSTIDGKMHACGHDGHTTMLLAAARQLAETRNFRGIAYFCFQPAEEGGAGAAAMLRDGLMDRFPCRAVFGMHNWPGVPLGSFAVRPGPVMAAADDFEVFLEGKGGHAALPHLANDIVVALATLVLGLQGVVSRRLDPQSPAVLSVTVVEAGQVSNVLPHTARLKGTVRTFDAKVHAAIYREMRRICDGVAAAHDVSIELKQSESSYPPTVNAPEEATFAGSVLADLVGEEGVIRDMPPSMGGEDFAFLAEERPGAFIFIGNGDSAPLHHPAYDFNDEILPLGAAYWVSLVEKALPRLDP